MFSRISAPEPQSGGRFLFQVDPSWFQGPGAFGGLTAATVLRAMQHEVRDVDGGRRSPRSFDIQFCAPVPAGSSEIEVKVERAGSAMSFLSARVLHAGKVCAMAMASLGRERSTDLDFAYHRPEGMPPVPSVEHEMTGEAPPPPFPTFLRNFRLKFALGSTPYVGAEQAHVGVWMRTHEPEPVDHALAVALLDVPPPALLAKPTSVRAMSSVTISYHFLAPLPSPELDPSAPMLVEVRSAATSGGYSDQEGRLYSPTGKMYAVARQLVAVLT
jgi:acyl-CoA thioesterase